MGMSVSSLNQTTNNKQKERGMTMKQKEVINVLKAVSKALTGQEASVHFESEKIDETAKLTAAEYIEKKCGYSQFTNDKPRNGALWSDFESDIVRARMNAMVEDLALKTGRSRLAIKYKLSHILISQGVTTWGVMR